MTEIKKEVDEILEGVPFCEKCDDPYFYLAIKGVVISGCEYHMIEVSKKLNKAGYLNRHLSHAQVPPTDKDN